MKSVPRNPTGLCFVCGKPTRLLIHGACSLAVADRQREAIRLRKGKATAKRYAAGGIVPGAKQ